jgi:uncharacterized membrane protein YhaH (DUF805 family)
MFSMLFSFRGRIARLAYLGWSIAAFALVFAIGAAFLLLGAGLAAAGLAGAGPRIVGLAMGSTMAAVAMWSGLALATRRVRDAGFDPVVIIGFAMTATIVDAVGLTRLTEVRFFWPLDQQTPVGALAAISYFLFVLLWPSATDESERGDEDRLVRLLGPACAIIGVVLATLGSAVLLAPNRLLERERHALSHAAMRSGVPSIAAALLRPLASAGHERALNDLGTMFVHGTGVTKDLANARRLLTEAAAKGSVRARVNLALLDNGGCGGNARASADTAAALQPLTSLDPVAPRLVQECLYFDATAAALPDRDRRLVESGTRIRESKDADALLLSGWGLLNRARTTQRPGNETETAAYERAVIPIARSAMETLFAAAEAGATGAYEPLGILSMQFGEYLGNDPPAVRLRDKSPWEWIEEGAAKGDWEAQCKVAQARMTSLRYDARDYSRAEFDAVVAAARACIDRKDDRHATARYDGTERLVQSPRQRAQRPGVTISSTEAQLKGLLFFDADKRLGAQGRRPDGAPAGEPRGGR